VGDPPIFTYPIENVIYLQEPESFVTQLVAVDFRGIEINAFLISGIDANQFTIIHGKQSILKSPSNFETNSLYNVNVVAFDLNGNSSIKSLVIHITTNGTTFFLLFLLCYQCICFVL
jgi:hypothetical protein